MHVGRKWQIEWDSFIHAIITGIGGLICIYLNANASFHMTGIQGMNRTKYQYYRINKSTFADFCCHRLTH